MTRKPLRYKIDSVKERSEPAAGARFVMRAAKIKGVEQREARRMDRIVMLSGRPATCRK